MNIWIAPWDRAFKTVLLVKKLGRAPPYAGAFEKSARGN